MSEWLMDSRRIDCLLYVGSVRLAVIKAVLCNHERCLMLVQRQCSNVLIRYWLEPEGKRGHMGHAHYFSGQLATSPEVGY